MYIAHDHTHKLVVKCSLVFSIFPYSVVVLEVATSVLIMKAALGSIAIWIATVVRVPLVVIAILIGIEIIVAGVGAIHLLKNNMVRWSNKQIEHIIYGAIA